MDTPPDQPSLRFERQFNVAPEIVFDTLTNPKLMIIWWGANVEFDIDLRLDGKWTIIRRENDDEYLATGVYLDVDRPRSLKYTYAMPQFSPNSDTISIQIEENDMGCSITFEQAGYDIAEELRELAQGDVSASEAGWQQGFDLMHAAWSKTI
jgi:uncharacterized protein YndB with AHSA1/START domain